jgi:hypothetical protein
MKTLESGSPKKAVKLCAFLCIDITYSMCQRVGRLLVHARQGRLCPIFCHKMSLRGLRSLIPSRLFEENPPTFIHQAAFENS